MAAGETGADDTMTKARTPAKGAALVTGAARRIGAEIALALAADGRPVAIHHRSSPEAAESVAASIREAGGVAAIVSGDLADPKTPAALIGAATDAVGPLTALINCASSFEADEVGGLDVGLWDRQMAVNLRAPVFLAEAFAARLPGDMRGCVVNILDQRVLKLTPACVSYTLSKAALATATVTLAQALAPRIRVVGVGPGPTLANTRQSPDAFRKQSAATMLGRGPAPKEIADAVLYLLAAESVTGVMLPVDGGQHLAWETADAID